MSCVYVEESACVWQFLWCFVGIFFQNLQSQMTEFEASAEPLQEWLNSTEVRVQESSVRLHDLLAKKQELNKLQVLENPRFFTDLNCFIATT